MTPKITITPKTKVGELLDNYPELEKVLMEMSPAFEKLKNPILRKTVAKVATLQQIAAVGGLMVDDIVNRLRKETGQDAADESGADSEYLSHGIPDWFAEEKIIARLDASPLINSGGSPMNDILSQTNLLNAGEIFELKTPFIPAPIIDMLRKKGYKVHCIQMENHVLSFFTR
jgi:Domain of unknown function (DUF1858)